MNSLSDETRYLRFFYRMHELTPAMLARFTQVDYDRELALVAVVEDPRAGERVSFAGVARYIENPDRTSAEYAIVVHDAWQRQGIGRALMERLIAAAKRKGLARLEGGVLRENARMLAFVESFGFTTREDPGDAEQTLTVLDLGKHRAAPLADARARYTSSHVNSRKVAMKILFAVDGSDARSRARSADRALDWFRSRRRYARQRASAATVSGRRPGSAARTCRSTTRRNRRRR